MQLVYKTAKNPGLQWTSYKVVLGESAGWINKNTGKDATKEEIYNVLAHLNGLYIRGEYVVGDDMGSLDNVHFGQLP